MRSIGEDHLNGVYCSVNVSRQGSTTDVVGLALGSQGHSGLNAASALETSNSLNNGASPYYQI